MRIWVYTASRQLTPAEEAFAKTNLDIFTGEKASDGHIQPWASHGNTLDAKATILWNRVLILAVDERSFGASGCSIDSSVRFLRLLADKLEVDLFDRMIFMEYQSSASVKAYDREALKAAFDSGELHDQSLMVDTLVSTIGQARLEMIKPLGQSWHKRLV